jgi:DNA-binding CsgD family transcriptional regulator
MSQNDKHGAVLIAFHEDILPFIDILVALNEAPASSGDASAPTRPTESSEYRLGDDPCVLGRDPLCQVRVREHRTDISRRHAAIKHEGGVYTIYDHSLHGTFVNGLKINGLCRLDTDDIIGLSNSHEMIRFVDYEQTIRIAITLTEREREVLHMLAAGHSLKHIADDLVISVNTVNSHLKNLYGKLDANSRSEAVSQARKLRLLED